MITLQKIRDWRFGNNQWDIGPTHVNIVLKNENDDGYTIVHIGTCRGGGFDRIAFDVTSGGYPSWKPAPNDEAGQGSFNSIAYLEDFFCLSGTMPEMDFSLEEIAQAEKIIEEIEHENA
jgi:hypothetical protein